MKTLDKTIFTVSLFLLAFELIVMIASIMLKPYSDEYLRGWGIAVLITFIPALYGTFRLLQDRRKNS